MPFGKKGKPLQTRRKGERHTSVTPGAPTGDGNKKRRVAATATAPPPLPPLLRRGLEASLQLVLTDSMKRTTIATHFIMDYDAVPTGRQKLWDGSGGVVYALVDDLPFSVDSRTVRSVMEDVVDCVRQGVPYDAGRKAVSGAGRKAMGRKPYIGVDTRYAKVLADTIEDGLGLRAALANVNAALKEDGTLVGPPGKQVAYVGYSAILHCYHALLPVVTTIKKKKQGSLDPESSWAKACHRLSVQLCVRFGVKPHARPRLEDLKEWGMADPGATVVPPGYDPKKMVPLSLAKVAFWDETHRKVRIGNLTTSGTVTAFPRDANGNLDPNGEVAEVQHELGVKYPGEVRFSLGVYYDGRCAPYSYTECTLMTIKDFEHHVQAEIWRVKGLKDGRTSGWLRDGRAPGIIYETDSPVKLPGCGPKAAAALAKRHGITTVLGARDAVITPWIGVTAATIAKWKAAATTASTDVPVAVDYRADANPYRARYGDADWRAKVTAATSMNKYKCVTDMVEHIVLETRKAGCTHFYHDALALMTATSTVDWMRGKGYLEMWIRPEHGILDEFPQFKGASPGNRPEWMPMDKYLNKNLHDGVVQHVGHTKRYAKEDPRKFRADTPRRLESAYLRVWEGCPSLERIRSDVSRFITALTEVKLAKGIILTEAGYGRNGAGRGGDSSNHGGSRVKTAVADEKWVHSDAKAGQARTRTVGK